MVPIMDGLQNATPVMRTPEIRHMVLSHILEPHNLLALSTICHAVKSTAREEYWKKRKDPISFKTLIKNLALEQIQYYGRCHVYTPNQTVTLQRWERFRFICDNATSIDLSGELWSNLSLHQTLQFLHARHNVKVFFPSARLLKGCVISEAMISSPRNTPAFDIERYFVLSNFSQLEAESVDRNFGQLETRYGDHTPVVLQRQQASPGTFLVSWKGEVPSVTAESLYVHTQFTQVTLRGKIPHHVFPSFQNYNNLVRLSLTELILVSGGSSSVESVSNTIELPRLTHLELARPHPRPKIPRLPNNALNGIASRLRCPSLLMLYIAGLGEDTWKVISTIAPNAAKVVTLFLSPGISISKEDLRLVSSLYSSVTWLKIVEANVIQFQLDPTAFAAEVGKFSNLTRFEWCPPDGTPEDCESNSRSMIDLRAFVALRFVLPKVETLRLPLDMEVFSSLTVKEWLETSTGQDSSNKSFPSLKKLEVSVFRLANRPGSVAILLCSIVPAGCTVDAELLPTMTSLRKVRRATITRTEEILGRASLNEDMQRELQDGIKLQGKGAAAGSGTNTDTFIDM